MSLTHRSEAVTQPLHSAPAAPKYLSRTWLTVLVFAIAMAWVESAVVFYLRRMINRIEPYQLNPLPLAGGIGMAEMIREGATLVMLFMVGVMAGWNWRTRIAFSAIAFGIWDIFYYIFLRALCGWPRSILDWDILFLIPLPWWGPVLAPVSIAALMIFWGTLVTKQEREGFSSRCSWWVWLVCAAGMVLALGIFMADAARVAGQGQGALRNLLPARFAWTSFGIAWVMMSLPAVDLLWRNRSFKLVSGGGASGLDICKT
jgi:hypothetical protein